jgi:hypothetical protein
MAEEAADKDCASEFVQIVSPLGVVVVNGVPLYYRCGDRSAF